MGKVNAFGILCFCLAIILFIAAFILNPRELVVPLAWDILDGVVILVLLYAGFLFSEKM